MSTLSATRPDTGRSGPPSDASKPTKPRRYDIDALRVGAVLLGILYHSTRPFDSEGWHIKFAEFNPWIELIGLAMTPWRMPLLFLLAGAGTYFALGFRSGGQYAFERLRRLLVPLVFGMLVIIPPQIYVERISTAMLNRQSPHNFSGTFFDFYPLVFSTGAYPAGNLSWHHLWFLAYLFVFSLVALPILLMLRRPTANRTLEHVTAWLEPTGRIFGLVVPIVAIELTLRPISSGSQTLIGDWVNLAHYGLLFGYGYLILASDRLAQSIVRQRRAALVIALGLSVQRLLWLALDQPGLSGGFGPVMVIVRANIEWAAILAILGYGRVYLNRSHPILSWASEISYPFYIFHQTVIVVLAYYLVQGEAGVWWTFAALLVLSLVATIACCELARRSGPFRPLFGFKSNGSPFRRFWSSSASRSTWSMPSPASQAGRRSSSDSSRPASSSLRV